MKVNCDASFRRETKDGDWGYIIRDDDRDLISAEKGRLSYVLDAFQAEVIVCIQGLQAAIDLGISKIYLEIGALQIQ